eukprot:8098449-Karenia_brevis.AAC.1
MPYSTKTSLTGEDMPVTKRKYGGDGGDSGLCGGSGGSGDGGKLGKGGGGGGTGGDGVYGGDGGGVVGGAHDRSGGHGGCGGDGEDAGAGGGGHGGGGIEVPRATLKARAHKVRWADLHEEDWSWMDKESCETACESDQLALISPLALPRAG